MNKLLLRLTINVTLLAPIVVLALSYGFVVRARGQLGGQISFEFYKESGKRISATIADFTVSERSADGRWKPVWSVRGKQRKMDTIVYGDTYSGLDETKPAQPLTSGRIYAAFASDGYGGSAMQVFKFRKDGVITFPGSLD